ncbi:hypothetical protein L2E82_05265 [Cichorium intybus]|uniref:Uncharacterized protein n=1 Tax=Cichorium intybus TaxID=13427 RepID=A0ACB9H843_CICIN|nr:hypothetical protein L2E82_05265 [Cichorium intybus]
MNSEAEVTIASNKSTVDCFGISPSSPAPIYRGIAEEFEHSLLKINDVEAIEGSKIITGSSVPLMAFLLIFAYAMSKFWLPVWELISMASESRDLLEVIERVVTAFQAVLMWSKRTVRGSRTGTSDRPEKIIVSYVGAFVLIVSASLETNELESSDAAIADYGDFPSAPSLLVHCNHSRWDLGGK